LSVIFASVLLAITVATAAENISTAFGVRLGDVFDPTSAIGEHSLVDGTPMYRFDPGHNSFRSFEDYYVLITPTTRRICAIWAIGKVTNAATGQKEQAVVMNLLEGKYGKRDEQGLLHSLYDTELIDQGNRSVMVKVTGFLDVTIEIRYYDRKLQDLAESERIELEGSKTDDSSL